MLIRSPSSLSRRRAVILIVVLSLLTLFAIVGLTFVLVANSQETSARIAVESETQFNPKVDAEAAMALALGQILYDISDDPNGARSALTGHSLARSIYGWNPVVINDKPFNGTGRLNYPLPEFVDTTKPPLAAQPTVVWNNNAWMVNYTYFPDLDPVTNTPVRPRYPERVRIDDPNGNNPPTYEYTGGQNVGYTYPDHQNFFLAAIDPNTGAVVTPSFHREYLFGRLDERIPANAAPVAGENVNWSNKLGKYLTLRPRPADHTLPTSKFPYPADRNGDVKNLDFAPGGNDSIWIDINSPVMRARNGTYYKMLVAPLILDLDGRVNLQAAGNLLGQAQTAAQTHRSHQGWGAWEVNPSLVLDQGTEWRRVFLGSDEQPTGTAARVRGRYDNDNGPRAPGSVGFPAIGGDRSRAWAQVDYNAVKEANAPNAASDRMTPPQVGSAGAFFAFPNFPIDSFGNGIGESMDHPRKFNPLNPLYVAGKNRHLPVSGMAQVLRYGGTGSDMLPSDLIRLLPQNLGSPTAAGTRRRNQVTLLSMDLDRPSVTPYVWSAEATGMPLTPANAANAPATRYKLGGAPNFTPSGNAPIPFANLGARMEPLQPSGSYTGTWQATNAALNRVNLDRSLPDYPSPKNGQVVLLDTTDPMNPTPTPEAGLVAAALKARREMVLEIWMALRAATGAISPEQLVVEANGNGLTAAATPEYAALRYLAQLAINIVDYIDNDDYNTSFHWFTYTYPDPNDANNTLTKVEFVYGTELPRVVINESYVQLDNSDPNDAVNMKSDPAGSYNVNVWVELMNPLPNDTRYRSDDTTYPSGEDTRARLAVDGKPAYRILLAHDSPSAIGEMRKLDNALGDPGAAQAGANGAIVRVIQGNWGGNQAQQILAPFKDADRFNGSSDGSFTYGLYSLGPVAAGYPLGSNPGMATTHTSAQMTYKVPVGMAPNAGVVQPTIILQRLANPTLPPQETNPNDPFYNPYVTIDYHVGQAWEGRAWDVAGAVVPPALNGRSAIGRMQPYDAANGSNRLRSQPAKTNEVNNTFNRQNSTQADPVELAKLPANGDKTSDPTLKLPFDWMVHLDRPLISPVELFHVSAYKPADLTQRFVRGTDTSSTANHQVAPWADQTARLYRFFETCGTVPRGSGLSRGGRVPGKINLNAVWTPEVLQALADPQTCNTYVSKDVDALAAKLIASRSPDPNVTGKPVVGPTDWQLAALTTLPLNRPFLPLSTGHAAPGDAIGTGFDSNGARGIESTIFRGTAGVMDFDNTTQSHPYLQKELLTKIYNHTTTRSNVFAVWLTIGYFECDPTGRQLGAEIGKTENRHIRHRGFAIVDRTQMQLWPTYLPGTPQKTQQVQPPPTTIETLSPALRLVAPITIPAGQQQVTVSMPNLAAGYTNPYTQRTWTPQVGGTLVIDPNTPDEETVTLTNGGTGWQAVFSKNHLANAPLVVRGNPGPWGRYDPRKDAEVVPYFAVID